MNKRVIKIFACLVGICVAVPAIAADTTVAGRTETDCDTINARINELQAIENPDDAVTTELTGLRATYRSNCVQSAAGRRTSGRAGVLAPAASVPAAVTADVPVVAQTPYSVLTEYLTARRTLCDELAGNMVTLADAGAAADELEQLQNQYDADCVDIDRSATVEIDPDVAAANMAAGLCPDGSNPNRFGCCDGETFKDLGNLVFACCPDDGGECHTPLDGAGAI